MLTNPIIRNFTGSLANLVKRPAHRPVMSRLDWRFLLAGCLLKHLGYANSVDTGTGSSGGPGIDCRHYQQK